MPYEDQLITQTAHAILGALGIGQRCIGTGGSELVQVGPGLIVEERQIRMQTGVDWIYQTRVTIEVSRRPS